MPLGDGMDLNLEVAAHLALQRCPHCSTAHPTVSSHHSFGIVPKRPGALNSIAAHGLQWFVYTCESCGGLIAAAVPLERNGAVRATAAYWVVPAPRPKRDDLPPRAQSFLQQAEETMTSPSAAVVMCASAVDAMLKARGYKEGSLYKRIEQAVRDNILTADMALWAHDVRLDANDERHADDSAEMPTELNARRCFEFTVTLGDVLFVLPARVRRGRELPKK
jgi:Domain of unknown function (DUF4145)